MSRSAFTTSVLRSAVPAGLVTHPLAESQVTASQTGANHETA
jgi:hypothetical protein